MSFVVEDIDLNLERICLRAKRWVNNAPGSKTKKHRFLALHGWLDNCASFDLLAPSILNSEIVALDLAGHGLSDHRGSLNTYAIWQDVIEIVAVADLLGWKSFSILGHSRGAMIATILAGTFPDKVEHVFLIESLLPHCVEGEQAPAQLAKSISQALKLRRRPRNYYASFEAAVSARADGFVPISLEDASILAGRGVKHDGKGYYWGSDPLLMAASELKLSSVQAHAFLQNISVTTNLYVAKNGMLKDNAELISYAEQRSSIRLIEVLGGHHLHMNEAFTEISRDINQQLCSIE